MFRDMRRMKQLLSPEESKNILLRGTSGVLSLLGDDGYPYGVPLSYVYDEGNLYFHCAKEGHKIDAIRKESKASFCVIDQDQVVPQRYTTYFRSVIAFGRIAIVNDLDEMEHAIEKLAIRYAPMDSVSHREKIIAQEWNSLCVLKMDIELMTGKEAKELVTGEVNP